MENPLLERFPGVIGFPVTPFTPGGNLDLNSFEANLDFLMGSGLAALAVCGSNGELHSLTLDEYQQVAESAGAIIGSAKGKIFGLGYNLPTARRQAIVAREAGADAVMIMAPYSSDLGEEGLAAYYHAVAEAAEIPCVLYQTKWSGLLPLPLLERLTDVENILMVKDEFGDLSHYWKVRTHFGERFFWVNGMAEPFVPMYWNLGVTTFTSELACFMPLITMEVFELARHGDFGRLRELLGELVIPLYEIRTRQPGYKCSMIKTAMNLAGLPGGAVRPPLIELAPQDRADLERLMGQHRLLAASEEATG